MESYDENTDWDMPTDEHLLDSPILRDLDDFDDGGSPAEDDVLLPDDSGPVDMSHLSLF